MPCSESASKHFVIEVCKSWSFGWFELWTDTVCLQLIRFLVCKPLSRVSYIGVELATMNSLWTDSLSTAHSFGRNVRRSLGIDPQKKVDGTPLLPLLLPFSSLPLRSRPLNSARESGMERCTLPSRRYWIWCILA